MSLFQLPGLLGVLVLPDFAFLEAAGLVALGLLAVPGLLADSHLLVTQRVCPWWTIWERPLAVIPVMLRAVPVATSPTVREEDPEAVRMSSAVVA